MKPWTQLQSVGFSPVVEIQYLSEFLSTLSLPFWLPILSDESTAMASAVASASSMLCLSLQNPTKTLHFSTKTHSFHFLKPQLPSFRWHSAGVTPISLLRGFSCNCFSTNTTHYEVNNVCLFKSIFLFAYLFFPSKLNWLGLLLWLKLDIMI